MSVAPDQAMSMVRSFDQPLTVCEVLSRAAGLLGAAVSMTYGPPVVAGPTLLAASTAQTWAYQEPSASAVLVAEVAAVERQIGELGLAERVQLAGFQDSIWPWLARAHVFALPSNYESLGIAVLEGMAAGLPVVATRVGGVQELVRPGVTGELVPPGDPGAMAEALVSVLGDPDTAMRMGNAGRAAAEDERMSA